ncbi:hypothetical protein KR032_006569, partial [Drosophila birchii]
MHIFCLLLGLISVLSPCQGQVVEDYNFTLPYGYARSVINMDELLYMEDDLVLNLEEYVEALSQKANNIRMGIQEMTNQHEQWLEPGLKPDWNPFNTYSLIRHMQADWMMWQFYIEKPVGQENLDYLNSQMLVMPQDSDFEDAATGFQRIQTAYELSASDMANGLLDGVQYNATLTARDCLALGRHLMNQSHWNQTKEWLITGIRVLNRIDPQPEMEELMGNTDVELFRSLGQTLVKLNESEAALIAYKNALKRSPYDAELFQEFRLAEIELLTRPLTNDSQIDDSFETLATTCCSGRCELAREFQLYCLYKNTASPFLRLAPIKVEIISIDPYIVLFHDVVSRKTMQQIRILTKPHLIPSSTYYPDTKSFRIVSYRTSKSVWLPWDMNNVTVAITEMLEDATALNMNSSEMFQVMNYGLGGVFQIHVDNILKDENRFNGTDDRLATALFYLSDVEQGGGTVFPFLNLTVFPQAGSVLFWHNLDTRGNEDPYTAHAGCPVIVGSKWVMSKWIYDMGQEFRKPCFD